jgi:hypothetical protein
MGVLFLVKPPTDYEPFFCDILAKFRSCGAAERANATNGLVPGCSAGAAVVERLVAAQHCRTG